MAMGKLRLVLGGFIALGVGFGHISQAASQEGTEALGTPLGAFVVYPSVTVKSEYNSNIFAEDTNQQQDIIFKILPEVRIESDWDNHSIQFLAGADFSQFVDEPNENVIDYRFLSAGRVDILEDTFATLNVGFRRDHEDRGSPDDVFGEEPTEFITAAAGLGFSHRFSQMWIELSGDVARRDFDDVPARGSGGINNDDRDRFEYDSRFRVGYDFNPEIGVFLQSTFNLVNYDDSTDDNGFARNDYGYGAAAGFRFDVTELVFGDLFVGYSRSEFDDARFGSQDAFAVGADLTWEVTELTTMNLLVSRSWEQTTVAGASSALTTNAGLGVSHSLLDTVTLDAGFNYRLESFEELERDDNTIEGTAGVTYLVNRFLHTGLDYKFTNRSSDAVGQDFTTHSVFLTMRFQY
jgi:hypothetical protein